MMLLRAHYTTELVKINKELALLWEKGNSLTLDALFESKDKALTAHMERFNKEMISWKNGKFEKDKLAFTQGRGGPIGGTLNHFFGRSRNSNYQKNFTPQNKQNDSDKDTDFSAVSSIQKRRLNKYY